MKRINFRSIGKGISLALTSVGLVLCFSLFTHVWAQQSFTHTFYGTVKKDGANVPDGTVVSARIGGVSYGSGVTSTSGGDSVYSLDFIGDDPLTPQKEGGVNGDTVSFTVGSDTADQTAIFSSGSTTNLPLTVTTRFTLTINIAPPGAGYVSKSPSKSAYNSGEQVRLTATANPGYTFSGWSGGASGTTNPITITMNSKKTVTANFTVTSETVSTPAVPKTGQKDCYNSSGTEINCTGTGQDGESQAGVEWPDPRFTVSDDCVTDNLTGLMWAKNANLPDRKKTWQAALDYVASINNGAGLCGYKDWRLPNVNELESLVNGGEADFATWLMGQGFSNVQSDFYWSSTTSAFYTGHAWIVYMWDGQVTYYGIVKSDNYYVWPVRSGQSGTLVPSEIWKTGQTTSYASEDDGDLEKGVSWPVPRFTDHGDGTITDNLTGLMWSKNANLPDENQTWQGALDYVKSINNGAGLGGYHDWRLPNRKELFSLIDHSKWNPALPASHPFQNVQSLFYWSSTTIAHITDDAWVVGMWHGDVDRGRKSGSYYDNYYVWPVRSGQVGGLKGNVTDLSTGNYLSSVSVSTLNKIAQTGQFGYYNLRLPSGTYEVTFSKPGYEILTISNVVITEGQSTELNAELQASETVSTPNAPSGPISGTAGINYTYSTGGSTSSYGHSVEYQFDWKGDGSDLSSWGSCYSVENVGLPWHL